MKSQYLPLPEIEEVSSALNFDTADCHVVGGCDLYITKAASDDRKLYNRIEQSLESQYESLLRLSASLSPPNASDAAISLNLSRSSPFGPLSEHSSRRTFAYLIATLNASHPDYDFSHVLRPTDFRRERNLKKVMNTIDMTLYNLRPHLRSDGTPPSPHSYSGSYSPGCSTVWGPRMWRLIDEQMSLNDCAIFSYSPEEGVHDDDDGAIWSLNYFFFNKTRKRVCYIYLRGIPILSHVDPDGFDGLATPVGKRTFDDDYLIPDVSAKKRSRYWLGDRPGLEDEAEEDAGPSKSRAVAAVLDEEDSRSRKGRVRAMSEEIAETMEV